MNSFNFKNALKNFKETKEKEIQKGDLILYKEIIDEKLKNNKKDDSIIKKFDDIEEERNEWSKKRQELLNKEKELKMANKQMSINEIKPSDKNPDVDSILSDNLSESNIPKEFEISVNKKEFKTTFVPKE
jgi:hypothetical protein